MHTHLVRRSAMIRSLCCLVFGAMIAAGGYFYATRDTHDSDWWAGECEREELKGRLEIFRVRVEAMNHGPDESRIKAAQEASAVLGERLSKLRTQSETLRVSIVGTLGELAILEGKRVNETRRQALGAEWGRFTSNDGRNYENAKVVAIDDGGVTLRHLHGSAKVRFADLTDEQRAIFGLDEKSSVAAEAEERKSVSAYHEWVESEERDTAIREAGALANVFLAKRAAPQKKTIRKETGVWMPLAASAETKSTLRIGTLDAPARKLATSDRIYSRPRNNIYFYQYSNGGGQCSPGYRNGSYRSWTFIKPPAASAPRPINPVTTP